MSYQEFIRSKRKTIQESGFDVDLLNSSLFPFQEQIVRKALKKGKYAIFADCGLGKTFMQLEWAYRVTKHTNKPVLVLAPLGVTAQTIKEGETFGIYVEKYHNQTQRGVYITNYEQLKNIDTSIFSGVVLDESSILKNFTGKMRNQIIDGFSQCPYKLACTATPSPNDPMELGNHAEFLDVMSRSEMLAMYFVHDGGQTSKWRLKGHAVDSFYAFVNTWAVMISKPSDLGFSDNGYNLPKIEMINHTVNTPKKDNGALFNDVAVSATNFNKALKDTKQQRLDKAIDIAQNTDGQIIIWVKHNDEGLYLKKYLPDAVEVKGSDNPQWKEDKLLGFGCGEFRILITKIKIAQFGLNYQNCNVQIFAALDFSFEGLYQGIRRSHRFGQKKAVKIHLITTDNMQNVIQSIEEKQSKFDIMSRKMQAQMNKFSIENTSVVQFKESKTDDYHIMRGDCVEHIKNIDSDSIGFSVFSPPFAELYTYSSHVEDMGNSSDYEQFLTQFKFLTKELYRVLQSGRNVAVHCMDLPIQKGKEGYIGLRDFSGMLIDAFQEVGFIYHSRVTIWKNPVVEMQRTKALGLLHKQIKKDSTMSRVGIPDYVLIFRKDGERNNPVQNTELSVDLWQKYASPVWMDIDYSKTLQGFRNARDEKDEKHICPLQLDTIERLIHLYTNKGDTVFTPFMGIGSEVYQAVKMGRKGIGIELKESYYDMAVKNCKAAVDDKLQTSLF